MLSNDQELTEIIIGAAITILNTLKPGLDEKIYERALIIELAKQGLRCDSQKQFPVHYETHHIGTLIPDLIVNDAVVVDPKVVTAFNETHVAQMLGYLNITGLRTALPSSQFQTCPPPDQTRFQLTPENPSWLKNSETTDDTERTDKALPRHAKTAERTLPRELLRSISIDHRTASNILNQTSP
jgi:GxxExxY protein